MGRTGQRLKTRVEQHISRHVPQAENLRDNNKQPKARQATLSNRQQILHLAEGRNAVLNKQITKRKRNLIGLFILYREALD